MLNTIKKKIIKERRWIIKYDKSGRIRDVKSLYKADEYRGKREMLTDEQVIEILEQEKLINKKLCQKKKNTKLS